MVLDEQHCEVEPLAQLEEKVAECRHLLVAQAAGRLVEQQQPRLGDECPRELDALERRVRQPGRDVRGKTPEPNDVERLVGALAAVRLAEPARARVGADEDVLEHGHPREERDVLERPCDAAADDLVRRELQQVLPVVENRAGIRLVESRDDVEGRRLARAVRADQAEDLTLGDVERDVVEGDDAPEAASEVLDGEQRHEAGILRRGGETSPVVVPLDDGIVRITFALPLGIDHVHAYALPADDGGTIVVDTGLGLPGHDERWQRILGQIGRPERIVVTHFHPDHVGGAAIVAGLTEAPVYQGALDYEYCRRAWTAEAAERSEQHLLEHGTPPEEAATVRAQQEQLTAFVHYQPDPAPLEPGQSIGGWEVLHLPGHADGHLALAP